MAAVTICSDFAAAAAKLLQSCPTLCDPIDGSPPGSSVPGILQARILERVASSYSRGSPRSRDQTWVFCTSCFDRWIPYHCANCESTILPFKNLRYNQPRQHIKKQRHYFVNKGPSSQGYGFSSGHVWMWELDYKENWVPKNWCFWTVVLEKTLESPLDCKGIKPVHPKGNQSWVFIGRTDFEAETPILWQPDAKSWLIWKDPGAGKDWEQEEKGTTEDEMVGWHHLLMGLGVLGSWWWTGRPGMLQFMGLQRIRHDWATELNWTELLLGRKVMTNLHSILKSRHITLPTKVCLVKAMVFPVVMYGCESWTVKKAEC